MCRSLRVARKQSHTFHLSGNTKYCFLTSYTDWQRLSNSLSPIRWPVTKRKAMYLLDRCVFIIQQTIMPVLVKHATRGLWMAWVYTGLGLLVHSLMTGHASNIFQISCCPDTVMLQFDWFILQGLVFIRIQRQTGAEKALTNIQRSWIAFSVFFLYFTTSQKCWLLITLQLI